MKAFFDSSVLIPAFLEEHEHHEASLAVFLKADQRQSSCGAHSLAEITASVTRLPGRFRLSGPQAILILESIRERLSIIALTSDEYFAALRDAANAGISGGAVYDALLAHCALKAGAEIIYSWNRKHFEQLGPEVARRLRTPKG